jgi:hypothetical protein
MSSKTLNLVDVQPGMRLTTRSGQCVEVVENPQDGSWLLCRTVPAGADEATGPIEPVFAQDIEDLT